MNYNTELLLESKREERDSYVMNMLPRTKAEAVPVVDLIQNGVRPGSVRASLRRLLDAKKIARVWDGNERFGRFLYFIA